MLFRSMSPQFTDSCYRVLDGVEMVCDSSIDNPYIETLILPDGCRIIEGYGTVAGPFFLLGTYYNFN